MQSKTEDVLRTRPTTLPECPKWCDGDHGSGLSEAEREWENRRGERTHYGHSQVVDGADFATTQFDCEGEPVIGQAEIVRVDDLATGVSRETGVMAWADGIMTYHQAEAFAHAILRAAQHAREANGHGGPELIPAGFSQRMREQGH